MRSCICGANGEITTKSPCGSGIHRSTDTVCLAISVAFEIVWTSGDQCMTASSTRRDHPRPSLRPHPSHWPRRFVAQVGITDTLVSKTSTLPSSTFSSPSTIALASALSCRRHRWYCPRRCPALAVFVASNHFTHISRFLRAR